MRTTMKVLPGYRMLSQLHDGPRTVVYRARPESAVHSVILKGFPAGARPSQAFHQAHHEYHMTRALRGEQVVRPYDLTQHQGTAWIVFEDFGGDSLDLLRPSRAFSVIERLQIAIKMAQALAEVHALNIVHNRINPSHIVLNPATGQLKLIGFGLAMLDQEPAVLDHSSRLAGDLAYSSPEQTGRTSRPWDQRSDLYSLGITLYELFGERLPFTSTDPMELIHSHMARVPKPLHRLKAHIPPPLSDIISKLLAKAVEQRYQSAWGLQADLERCLAVVESGGARAKPLGALESFPLGRQDKPAGLPVSKQLYGRERERETLLQALAQARTGQTVLLWVAGYSGVGKTSLVRELARPIAQQGGYFIEGKFDPLQHHPYSGVVAAFQGLVRRLFSESDLQLEQWQARLKAALGPTGQVIIEVIPEVERLLGPQPAVPKLDPVEAQHRLHWVFQNFLRVFGQPEQPLVLFLDDLQWADPASLKWMERMLTDQTLGGLLLIGAYRENELQADHPLALTVEALQKRGLAAHRIQLTPLGLEPLTRLLSEVLHSGRETVTPLAALIAQKTAGNPFFIETLLKALYHEKQLTFDIRHQRWQWDLAQLQARAMTGTVIQLLIGHIQRLSATAQDSLRLAACVGNRFESALLAQLSGKTPQQVVLALQEAVVHGLLEALDHTATLLPRALGLAAGAAFKFSHDQIRQAAYESIPASERPILHRRIGGLLLEQIPADKQEEHLFAIVDQLNASRELIDAQTERDKLAELNWRAGCKAKASAAWESAFNYLKIGIELSGSDAWQRQYPLTLGLHEEAAEAAYLNQQLDWMERLSQAVSSHAGTLLDTVKICEVRIQSYVLHKEPLRAIEVGLEMLEQFGVRFPAKPNKWHLLAAFTHTKLMLSGRRPEDLIDLPKMTDPHQLAVSRILARMGSPAFFAFPELTPLLAFKLVYLSLTYGNSPNSALGYAWYGVILLSMQRDIGSGYRFSQLAVQLQGCFNAQEFKARVLYIGALFSWKVKIRERLKPLLEIRQSALEAGDLEYVGYCTDTYFISLFLSGVELVTVEREMLKYRDTLAGDQRGVILRYQKMGLQAVQNLIRQVENPCQLIGDVYDERQMLPCYKQKNDVHSLVHAYLLKLRLCYLFYDYQQAAINVTEIEAYLGSRQIIFIIPICLFYISLAQLAIASDTSNALRKRLLRKVTAYQKKMRKWARHRVVDLLHRYCLVEAERCRVLGHTTQAMDLYDQAIALAKQNRFTQDEALANELAGRFYLAGGKTCIARAYLQEARAGYRRWGAIAKVKHLEQHYPEWLADSASEAPATFHSHALFSIGRPASALEGANLDLAALMQAAQALSGEMVLERLLEKLMTLVLADAGADKAFLILKDNDQLLIRARISSEDNHVGNTGTVMLTCLPVADCAELSTAVVYYVARATERVVLDGAADQDVFTHDPYLRQHAPRSLLCMPILQQGQLLGLVYLENTQLPGVFTPTRVEVVRMLAAQAAISLENARLYTDLERSEANFRSVYENAAEGIFQCTPEGRLLGANPALAELLGYDSPRRLLATLTDLFAHCFADPVAARTAQQRLREAGRIIGLETQWYRQDGNRQWVAFSAWRVAGVTGQAPGPAAGEGLHYDGLVVDISARKEKEQAEREREAAKAARAQAEAANRLKSEFLATMSHEIRTPLNGMLGLVELLRRRPLLPHQVEPVDTLHYSGEALLAILDEVLDYSKLEAGHYTSERVDFSLPKVLDSLLLLMSSRAAAKGLQLSSSIAAQVPPWLRGDSRCLRQVLLNLISNAIKFTEQGRIGVHVEMSGNRWLKCSVTDTGIGIAEAAKDQLFQRFAQADASITRRFGGSGLGLAICKQLLDAVGGEIAFDSRAGQGSCFWFVLPVEESTSAAALPQPDSSTLELPPLRLLLVEDMEINQQVAVGLLEQEGHRVTVCASGQAALDRLGQAGGTAGLFDAVLMDVNLPDLDGLETTRRIRRLPDPAQAAIPIIALTAAATAADRQQCLAAGMNAVVAKPIHSNALRQALAGTCAPGPRRPAPEQATALDRALLQQHYTALGEEKLAQLLRELRRLSEEHLGAILHAWQAGEWHALASAAHRLAGMTANLGLAAVSQRAKAIEHAAEAQRLDELAGLLSDLDTLHRHSLDALEELAPFLRDGRESLRQVS